MRPNTSADSTAAMLEMVREGVVDLRQDGAYQPLYLRRRAAAP
jgi:segregation and condensation protein A